MTFRRLIFVLLALLAIIPSTPATALDVDVVSFRLGNGMQVVVIPDRRAPVVTHMVWYRVGSADEPQGKAGIAHFLEHLMFKGTKRFPAGEFSRLVRANGGEENAFTTRDYTAYFQRVARDRLEMVMELEADRMQNLVLSEEDVRTELLVVQEERRERTDNDPSSLLSEQLDMALYAVHPYRKPVIGWMQEVEQLKLSDALDFYHAHYEPANAVLIVAGDVTADEVKVLAEKHYGTLKNLRAIEPAERTSEPQPIAERRVIMEDARVSSPSFRRSYLAPAAAKVGLRGDLALQILASELGGGSQSRLHRRIVVEQKLGAYAGAWYSGDQRDYGTFGVYAAPNQGVSMEALETAIDKVVDEIAAGGITPEELDRNRNSLAAQSTYLLDSQQSLAQIFGTALMTGQSVDDILNWEKTLAMVTVDDVAAAARQVIDRKASATGILLPAGAP